MSTAVNKSFDPRPAVVPESGALSNWRMMAWMFRFLKPVKALVFISCLWLTLGVGAEILSTRQFGEAADAVKAVQFSPRTSDSFWAWTTSVAPEATRLRHQALLLCMVTAAMLLFRYLREVSNSKMSMTLVYFIREAVYDKLQRVGFSFHDAIPTGQLINRALTDLQNIRMFIQTAVLMTLEIFLIVGGYIVLLATRNGWLAILSLVPIPIWTLYVLHFGKQVQPASKLVMDAEDKCLNVITENIAGVHVIKAFASQEAEVGKYRKVCDLFYGRVTRRIHLYASFTPIIRSIGSFSHLSLFFLVAVLMIKGKLNVGDFLILGSAMGAILARLQQVNTISDQYQNAIVSSRRLLEVLAAKANVPENPNARDLPAGPGTVRFENVGFAYGAGKPVLRNVNFEVPGGKMVAIVGPTGSGKTTLVNMIARFYDPSEGRLLIDGVDTRDVKLDSLRPLVAFVFQETFLFSDTVSANIAYGHPGASAGDIEAAARLAQAHEFIEQLPRGYDSLLGERGSSLSGGQRQRLAIARAILQNPRILILDDATASVDPETDDLIHRALSFVMKGRTTFVIAHRISTAQRADQVVVLEHGRVTQMGTHEELMSQNGHYRQIAQVQLMPEEVALDADGERPSHMDRMRNAQKIAAEKENAEQLVAEEDEL